MYGLNQQRKGALDLHSDGRDYEHRMLIMVWSTLAIEGRMARVYLPLLLRVGNSYGTRIRSLTPDAIGSC